MTRALAFAFVSALGAVPALAQQTQPQPQPQPAPATTPFPPAPGASPSSAPTVSPLPSPSPSPSEPVFHYVYTPHPGPTPAADDGPRIVEVDLTDRTLHQNTDVALRVLTSQSVAAVVVSTMGHDLQLPHVAPGMWGGQSHIPSLPFFFLNRDYAVEVRALDSGGHDDRVTLDVRLVR